MLTEDGIKRFNQSAARKGNAPFRAGDALAGGRFVITRPINSGGTATVYEAEDRCHFRSSVALKVVNARDDTPQWHLVKVGPRGPARGAPAPARRRGPRARSGRGTRPPATAPPPARPRSVRSPCPAPCTTSASSSSSTSSRRGSR